MAACVRLRAIGRLCLAFFQLGIIHTCTALRQDGEPATEFADYQVTQFFMVRGRSKREVSTNIQGGHLHKVTLGFQAFGQEFLLDLHQNRDLFPNHFIEKYQHKGKTVINKLNNSNHCYYQGQLRYSVGSWAALSTCNGVSGIISDGVQMHFIEPVPSATNEHFVYRQSDMLPRNLSCGFTGSLTLDDAFKIHQKRFRRDLGIRGPYNSDKQSRYVELVLVNDYKEYKEMKENRDAVVARNKEIANIVNALYSPLNIFIALVGVEVWSEFDQITLSKDGDTTLTNFLHYRRERLVSEIPNDNAQLITGITFEGGVVGKALKGPICTYEYSGGVNMDHSPVVALVATTVAHELGHNFGMEHDNDECSCPDDRCIMAPSSSSTSPTHWSSCSLTYLSTAFKHGMDYCLRNRPSQILGPVCGNGFVENGEQCDCGLKKFCNNPCCNATSCTLFANASCATGECCDVGTCQLKVSAVLCRRPEGECDLPEFCDGKNEFCPNDVFKQDGSSCKTERAYCYHGNCRSHSDQCKLLWGTSGQMSDSRCFDQNKRGTASGNCGYHRLNQTYKPCDKEDILCGMLHCTHLNERLEFGMESVAIQSRSFITTGGKILACRSAIVDLGLNSIDPGLAPDGARCGENKVCVGQRCMPVESLKKVKCSHNCNGKGTCNSRGNCHCDVGFAPPFCDSHGSGGSEDSGPASDPDVQNFVTTVLYILFLGIIPSTIVAGCAGYYYRGHLRLWWMQKAREKAIRSRAKEAAQRKKQAKVSVDRNSLRSMEISTPVQPDLLPANALVKTPISTAPQTPIISHPPHQTITNETFPRKHSVKAAKLNLDRNSLRNLEISQPILQKDSCISTGVMRIVPIRPAPPRPTSPAVAVHRTPSWSPAPGNHDAPRPAVVVRASSIQEGSRPSSTQGSARRKRLSGPSMRPTNPPPRPPPPKTPTLSTSANQPPALTSLSSKNESVYEQPVYSEIYDDCQTNVAKQRNERFREDSTAPSAPPMDTDRLYSAIVNGSSATRNQPPSLRTYAVPSTVANCNGKFRDYNKGPSSAKNNAPSALKHTPSVVASLAKRFEPLTSSGSGTRPIGENVRPKPLLMQKPQLPSVHKAV